MKLVHLYSDVVSLGFKREKSSMVKEGNEKCAKIAQGGIENIKIISGENI